LRKWSFIIVRKEGIKINNSRKIIRPSRKYWKFPNIQPPTPFSVEYNPNNEIKTVNELNLKEGFLKNRLLNDFSHKTWEY
jgi:hypothetical protein